MCKINWKLKWNEVRYLMSLYKWVVVCAVIFIVCSFVLADSNKDALLSIVTSINSSILASGIFHYMTVYKPEKPIRKAARRHIEHELRAIQQTLRMVVYETLPFYFSQNKEVLQSDFIKMFEKLDLLVTIGKTQKKVDAVNSRKCEVETLCKGLLANYSKYMTKEELDKIRKLLDSDFIQNQLSPWIELEDGTYFEGNQKQMAESFYKIYQLKIDEVTRKDLSEKWE